MDYLSLTTIDKCLNSNAKPASKNISQNTIFTK